MIKLSELLQRETISDRVKVPKTKSGEVVAELNGIDGVKAEQITTDEFDIPPTALIRVEVDLTEI